MEMELRPRLCYLVKEEERGYGFHLHGERNKGGQFIRKVEPGSSADLAGVRAGDRLVEVNGENVETETHHQVVNRIRAVPHRTRLLVVDRETDDYLRSNGLTCIEELAIEMGTLSPRPSPRPTPCASPIPRLCSPLSLKTKHTESFQFPSAETPTEEIPQDKVRASSNTFTPKTDTQVETLTRSTVELLPRLCHLQKNEHGYGFNLHSDKRNHGQFVRSVDLNSAAEEAGIRAGDRVVEVNGVNITGLRHSEVVALIKTGSEEVRLLVVDQETDELFQRLGIVPTSSHITEIYVDDIPSESMNPTPSPTTEIPTTEPIVNVTSTDSSIITLPPKYRVNGSSASQSSRSSTTQSEISSSEMSFQVPEEDDRRFSYPFVESGLRLSSTAAEAKQKVLGSRNKKRAPPMDWTRKQELFSSF